MLKKSVILAALTHWVNQRPGLDFANYGDVSAYRSELRSITKDRQDAHTLLAAIGWRDSITAENLLAGTRAYSGRLQIVEKDGKAAIDYCTGQYWPTEYRSAACAVLASALWDYVRTGCMPTPKVDAQGRETYEGLSAGDWIRRYFRREFGVGIARRWFN